MPLNFTKSINLALSERGINSMKWAGNGKRLIEAVLGETIPMHGRMIHGRNKLGDLQQASQAYDVHGRVSLLLALSYQSPNRSSRSMQLIGQA